MSAELFFNRPGKPFGVERLYRDIRDARDRLTVASAWFTDTHVAEAIIDAPAPEKLVLLNAADLGRGDKRAVTMVKRAAAESWGAVGDWMQRLNQAENAWMDDRNGDWSWKELEAFRAAWEAEHPYPTHRFHLSVLGSRDFTQGVMHHKFIAIDDRIAWVGSYNFTFNAQRNYETLLRLDDSALIQQFHAEAWECASSKRHAYTEPDGDGMYRCVGCANRFYPDEGFTEGNYGDVWCVKCRTTETVIGIFDAMPSPLAPPPKPPAPAPPAPPAAIRSRKK